MREQRWSETKHECLEMNAPVECYYISQLRALVADNQSRSEWLFSAHQDHGEQERLGSIFDGIGWRLDLIKLVQLHVNSTRVKDSTNKWMSEDITTDRKNQLTSKRVGHCPFENGTSMNWRTTPSAEPRL